MAWILGLLLVASLPAGAAPAASSDLLVQQLDRLDAEVASWQEQAPTEEARQQLMRHLRYLHHLALKLGADKEMVQRAENLEFQVRTGRSRTPDRATRVVQDLDKVGTVSGKVTRSSDGAPLADIEMDLWGTSGGLNGHTYTDASGNYDFGPQEAGEYFIIAWSGGSGYISEIYDDIHCPDGCDPSAGTPITLLDQDTLQIDITMELGGSISGTVLARSGEPISYTTIEAGSESGVTRSASSDEFGRYTIDGLPEGAYFVNARNWDSYRDELFDDIPCPQSTCDVTTGTPVSVALGAETEGIDFVLEELGKISGRVVDSLTGGPIPFQDIVAFDSQGSPVANGNADDLGYYTIGGLNAGIYYLQVGYSYWGFEPELYDGIPCPDGNCDPTSGTPVEVEFNETATGIDFVLEGGCVDSATRMCLSGNRFLVEATWKTGSGNAGQGYVRELTHDSGYFWFFGEDNIEMVVKVLDACTLPGANNFWVFAGGLTDVEVTLTVTDTQSGEVRTYSNPIGTPFQPIQDTSAFNTCP